MTHAYGFYTDFQPAYHVPHYWYDPGLDVRRSIEGMRWTIEAMGSFYLPQANGRGFSLRVYFGEPGVIGTYCAEFHRFADVNTNRFRGALEEQTGTNPMAGGFVRLEHDAPGGSWFWGDGVYPNPTTFYFQLERFLGELTARWSLDGSTWTEFYTHDFGTGIDGRPQTIVLNGNSWFSPAGSYADWDYVRFDLDGALIPMLSDSGIALLVVLISVAALIFVRRRG